MREMDHTSSNTPRRDSCAKTSALDRLPANIAALVRRLDMELRGLYGEKRYGGLILYGSYARGEAGGGSDVDLLLLLEGEVDPVRELIRMEDVKWPLALESDYALSVLPVSVQSYHSSEEPFLWSARMEGIPAA
jgi:uncharacterized protein